MRVPLIILTFCACGLIAAADGPSIELGSVDGVVSVVRKAKGHAADNGEVAIWLKPAAETSQRGAAPPVPRARLKIVQHDKRFEPRFLVVQIGSAVDFPNLDPFFHNVFSLFDGKRFDLGLYEAGSSRSVSFNRAGVCYIFCNIHPEMSAVVLVVDTPYYTVTSRSGEFSVRNVPAGRYFLSVWHERSRPEQPAEFPREITVSGPRTPVGVIRLIETAEVIVPHKNKYGRDYSAPPPQGPAYR